MKANCKDTDQTPCNTASDLALGCLPMSHKKGPKAFTDSTQSEKGGVLLRREISIKVKFSN